MTRDLATIRNKRIATLVRRKLSSGNAVPVERCTVLASEVAALDALEPTAEELAPGCKGFTNGCDCTACVSDTNVKRLQQEVALLPAMNPLLVVQIVCAVAGAAVCFVMGDDLSSIPWLLLLWELVAPTKRRREL